MLCILNNFFKTYLKIITEGFTDGIYSSAFDSSFHSHQQLYKQIYLVGISHSPTTLPTHLICRYLTVPATMIDESTDRYLLSIFQTLTDNFTDDMYPSVYHTITDGINPSVYFKREKKNLRAISVCKTIGKCFFYVVGRYSDGWWYYRRTYSVGKDIGKNKLPKTLNHIPTEYFRR
jgi:hypothetical protein